MWPIPTKKKEVQTFPGFANYYHWFLVNYTTKGRLCIDLSKDATFTCRHTQQQGCDKLQAIFVSAPILTQFDRTLETIIQTYASKQEIAGILS